MKRRSELAVVATAAVVALAGCSAGDAEDQAGASAAETVVPVQTSTQAAQQTPGMDGTPLPEPTPVPGAGQEEVASAVEKFALNWACYRTFAQQPQREWFDSWSNLATEEFVQQQRVAFADTWSWAWNTETQVVGCQRRGELRVTESGDSTAIARITVERHLYHADARADDGRRESKTYDVAVETDDSRIPQVLGAAETEDDTDFPPPLHSLAR